jgi:hypothetical protein
VLAREVEVHAPTTHDGAAVYGVLREAFAGCFVYAVGRGESTFIAASPELLIRREGLRARTLALAGSIGRSADPAVDDHLGERMLRSPTRTARSTRSWPADRARAAPARGLGDDARRAEVVRIANIQHLATAIRAQLAHPVGAIELAGCCTRRPPSAASRLASRAADPGARGIDRGWYAGPVGWTDANGTASSASRCAARCPGPPRALLRRRRRRRRLRPGAELAETEVKLGSAAARAQLTAATAACSRRCSASPAARSKRRCSSVERARCASAVSSSPCSSSSDCGAA